MLDMKGVEEGLEFWIPEITCCLQNVSKYLWEFIVSACLFGT